jgi:membrane-associated phospholipid phosphatase
MLSSVVRNRVGKMLWLLWPAWVWFCVMATANHYLLDVLGGAVVAVVAIVVVGRLPQRERTPDAAAEPA